MDLPWNGWFECGSWKNPVSEDFFRNKICAGMEQLRKPLDAQIQQLESERDALQDRVNRLEEAGDALQSAVVGVEGMTHWQWLATAHEADLKWRAAKESKP